LADPSGDQKALGKHGQSMLVEWRKLDEAEYWLRLEYRVSREFAGMAERRLQYLWCDGLIPTEYHLEGPRPRITGLVWICNGTRQAEWTFALLIPRTCGSSQEIDWASLVPPDNMTKWLSVEEGSQRIEIEPAAALPEVA
jgi:hypothetical protein